MLFIIQIALLFLAHKSTGPNKNSYCQSLGFRLGNFHKAPEPDMKYQQLSSGDREKTLGQCLNTYLR